MELRQLQAHMKATRRYAGAIDNLWGALTEAGILLLLTDGPDTKLTEQDFVDSASRTGLPVGHIKAVTKVEAAGAGFFAGRPLILPEPHRFSKLTNHRFDQAYPAISYPSWGQRPYPRTQDERYKMLLRMIRLDVDAGFAAASYGRFQILGENHLACGYSSSMAFAEAMARDERTQLVAFERFLSSRGLLGKLKAARAGDPASCEAFCAGYNGTAFRRNAYHIKLAEAL